MGRKSSLALCWDEDIKKPIAIKYRKSNNEIIEKSLVEIKTIIKMLQYHMVENNTSEIVIEGIRVTKEDI